MPKTPTPADAEGVPKDKARQARLKFERMHNYPNLSIEDAAHYAQAVDEVAEAFDEAATKAGCLDEDRLRLSHMLAGDQHQALVDLIATSQAQTLKEALTQMQVAGNVLDGLAMDHEIRSNRCSDLRKLMMIFESVILILEDHLQVRRQDFDPHYDGGRTMGLRPFMLIKV